MALLGIVVQMYLGLATMFLFLAGCTVSSSVRSIEGLGSIAGDVNFVSSPPSVRDGKRESNSEIILFREARSLTLPADITADGGVTISKGTTVDVYFLHADRLGRGRGEVFRGSVTFDTEILGVMGLGDNLQATHSLLGLKATRYPRRPRGMEARDQWTVSKDSRTLSVTMRVGKGVDQLRVIVRAKQK